jgi:acyl-coenzyme A thioesterase PaaI-like protein
MTVLVEVVPDGFRPFVTGNPFITRAGTFYSRQEADGTQSIGTVIGLEQSNSEGFAHGGFLMAFADLALTIVSMGITLNLSADFVRAARIGDWIEGRVIVRKRTPRLIFADSIVTCGARDILRISGIFQPFEKQT